MNIYYTNTSIIDINLYGVIEGDYIENTENYFC